MWPVWKQHGPQASIWPQVVSQPMIFIVHTTARGHVDVHGPRYHQRPCWCLWSWLPQETVLISVVSATTRGLVDLCSLCYSWRLCWLVRLVPLPETMMRSKVHAATGDHAEVQESCCGHDDVCSPWCYQFSKNHKENQFQFITSDQSVLALVLFHDPGIIWYNEP